MYKICNAICIHFISNLITLLSTFHLDLYPTRTNIVLLWIHICLYSCENVILFSPPLIRKEKSLGALIIIAISALWYIVYLSLIRILWDSHFQFKLSLAIFYAGLMILHSMYPSFFASFHVFFSLNSHVFQKRLLSNVM